MTYGLRVGVAILASFLLYFAVFGLLVGRPISRGFIFDMLAVKLEHARASAPPRIFIVAGSNARFSHSCAVLAEELGRPCTNMGINWGVGIDFMLDSTLPLIGPGDLVYVPMEYPGFAVTRRQILTSEETGERVRRDPAGLLPRGPEGWLRAAFFFDLPYLIQGGFEMAFAAMGGGARFFLTTISPEGDGIGHSEERGQAYRDLRATATPPSTLVADVFPPGAEPGNATEVIGAFLRAASAKGAVVVGGLPTMPSDAPLPDALVDALRDFYTRNGAAFAMLPNRSRYPRNRFYDTLMHLAEEGQRDHSRSLAPLLRPYLEEAARRLR